MKVGHFVIDRSGTVLSLSVFVFSVCSGCHSVLFVFSVLVDAGRMSTLVGGGG